MTIPDGYVIFVQGHPFFLIEMLRPKEDVPGDYLEGKAWYWKVVALNGEEISYGSCKHRRSCKGSAKRAAARWLKVTESYYYHGQRVGPKLKLNEQHIQAVEAEVKMILHAHRDCLRNQGKNSWKIPFDCRDGYYGEAFGVFRALAALGIGNLTQAVNHPEEKSNLMWWFAQLKDQVLKEENFGGSGECKHCRERYGKDDATVGKREVQCPACRGYGKVNIAGHADSCGQCRGVGKVSRKAEAAYLEATRR